jgi:hypothetical protein
MIGEEVNISSVLDENVHQPFVSIFRCNCKGRVISLKEQSEGWVEKFGMGIFPGRIFVTGILKGIEVDTSTSFDERDNQLGKLVVSFPARLLGWETMSSSIHPFAVFFLVPEIVTNNCEDQSAPIPSEPGLVDG